jgi:hypothetical protein
MSIEAASNAIVSVVGFYTAVMKELTTRVADAEQRAAAREKQIAELAAANIQLQNRDVVTRKVIGLATSFVMNRIEPPDTKDSADGYDRELVALIEALKGCDGVP